MKRLGKCCSSVFAYRGAQRAREKGLTLIELMLVMGLMGVLATLALSTYPDYLERVRVSQAKADIQIMYVAIEAFQSATDRYPDSLADIGKQNFLDPWGNPYQYQNLTGPGNGKARRDKRLNPINTYYDLFSMGKNGVFKKQISNKDSLDDIILANDGAFIDLAANY